MGFDKVKNNVYFDSPSEFPHSSRNHFEDFHDYVLPLGRMHHAALHDRGIAAGLEVSGAPGAAAVVIEPGLAVDGAGQVIVLSAAGHGDIGSDPPNGSHQEVPVPVQLPLSAMASKTVYVTIQFAQILRALEGSGGRLEQVPWLRLQPTTGTGAYVDDGASVILAIATIDAAGNLTLLKEADGSLPFGRSTLGIPVDEVRVRRSHSIANKLQETPAGKLKAGTGGGLQMTVPSAGDSIAFMQDGGANFNSVEMRANSVVCKDGAGRAAVQISAAQASIGIGTHGIAGSLSANNASGQATVSVDGSSGSINANRLNASSGAIGSLSVNQITDRFGFTIMGNPARKVTYAWLFCNRNGTTVQDLDLGIARPFFAFVSLVMIDPEVAFDRDNAVAAEVYMVDGSPAFKWITGGDHWGGDGADSNCHAPATTGFGRVIRFRARNFGPDCVLAAVGVVFYE